MRGFVKQGGFLPQQHGFAVLRQARRLVLVEVEHGGQRHRGDGLGVQKPDAARLDHPRQRGRGREPHRRIAQASNDAVVGQSLTATVVDRDGIIRARYGGMDTWTELELAETLAGVIEPD